jgi:hypothetical protein
MTAGVFTVHFAPPMYDEAIVLPASSRLGERHAFCIRGNVGQFGPFQYKESVMGNFEDKDRNKPTSGQQGQGQQGNRPGSQNEPGRESNTPREGQGGREGESGREGQGGSSSQRPGSKSGQSGSENDEESA